MRAERNLNIEALRCFLMLLITFGHCCFHGAYSDNKIVLIAETATTFAVDTFAFISGWYSVKLSISRMLRFVGYGLFAFMVVNLLSFCLGRGGVPFNMGWYGNSYFVVMLLAPYINYGMESILHKHGARRLLSYVAIYLCFMFVMWLPITKMGVAVKCGFGGHTVLLLLAMYLLGRSLNLSGVLKSVNVKTCLIALAVCEIVVLGWSGVGRILGGAMSYVKMWDYQSPALVFCAVAVFTIF